MIDNETCPHCGSDSVEDDVDGIVMPDEIKQDFRCNNCGTIWEATFAPIDRRILKVKNEHTDTD